MFHSLTPLVQITSYSFSTSLVLIFSTCAQMHSHLYTKQSLIFSCQKFYKIVKVFNVTYQEGLS